MSYRKITVDGAQYEYVIGKTHLKIKGKEAIELSKVARKDHEGRLVIGPAMIAAYIKHGYQDGKFADGVAEPNTLLSSSKAKMRALQGDNSYYNDDVCIAASHRKADAILCDVLTKLGYGELVAEFERLHKWYS